ncbi:hypothetical protein K0I73_11260 [Shewanella mesophila]|uniref:hypothetical protein n=1 Tax=Shewanella mesophila TaxID=2864208 RepID=UPI001C6622B7|nr:hypothetical protein [Shewanella mesophila]QYJ84840.1 hypothetical protein K0I73_11260 [Shewanella mesophila]
MRLDLVIKYSTLLTLGLLSSSVIAAEDTLISSTPIEESKTMIRVGGFYSNSNSSMDVTDPLRGDNFKLDFEEDLNLEESQFLPFFEVQYQFNSKHSIYFDWKQLHRNAEVKKLTVPFQVTLDNQIYDIQAGGRLETTLNIDIARLGYKYNFYQGNNYNLGLSLGLHTMFIKTAFDGDIGVCIEGESIQQCGATATPKFVDEEVTAPLPDIGLYGDYEFVPGFTFNAHAQYFYIKLDDVEGSLIDVKAGIEAAITENWHMSAAFNYYKVDVDFKHNITQVDSNVADYNLYYSFIGPMLSVSYRF